MCRTEAVSEGETMNWEGAEKKNSIVSYPVGINHTFSVNEEEHPAYVASLSILVQLFMLGCTFMIGHFLRRNKITVVPEAGAALLLGVLVGMIVRVSKAESGFSSWINFNNQFFFYFLLPPIILPNQAGVLRLYGYAEIFFGNFGAICTFAFAGTLISTFGVGILIYIFGSLNWTHAMPFLVCLTFGALISATDPVTVLAFFNFFYLPGIILARHEDDVAAEHMLRIHRSDLGVDPNLYAYVFGESVLNDAVAIVMYRTVLGFVGNDISKGGILAAFSYFIANFIGSFSIGSLCAIGSAIMVKYGHLNDHGLGVLESCLMVLFPYASYMMADALELSGIVSILFAGIAMKHYTAPLMSSVAQTITTNFFQMLAKLSETFVFIYMGVAMFLEKQSWNSLGFTFFTIISILIARALNVYTCSILVNKYREKPRHIPLNHQHALWFSGLRGAMAFALALQSVTDLPDNHGRVLLTSTLFTIFFTVLLVGGLTPFCLTYLKIEMSGPSEGHGEPDEPMPVNTRVDTPQEESDDETIDAAGLGILERHKAKLQRKLRKLKQDADFAKLDKKYIKPFFASPTGSEPSSPNSPESDKGPGITLVKLPARTHERRSLIADAFYARSDPPPAATVNRIFSRLASGVKQQVEISWSAPNRRPSSEDQETWSEAATIPSVSSEVQSEPQKPVYPIQVYTNNENSRGDRQTSQQGERKNPVESSWSSYGGWPSRTPTQAETEQQHVTTGSKKSQPPPWNPVGSRSDDYWLQPIADGTKPPKPSSNEIHFATIDLT